MAAPTASVPIVDFGGLQNASTKDDTLKRLREAIFSIGFLYLVNTGLEDLNNEAHRRLPEFFALSNEEKNDCNMRNSPAFLGYTSLGAEKTASRTDLREQFDFGTPYELSRTKHDPLWKQLEGPSQYPKDPELQAFIQRYLSETTRVSRSFLHFVAECLDLSPTTFDQFLGNMHRLKFVKYPPAPPGSQGVGPHKDSTGLFTFLFQDQIGGLQVLARSGQWIDAPPIEGSLVVNVQQGFEAITGGLCPATIHRVIAPTTTSRYSIPFFLGVKLDLTLDELKTSAADIIARIPYQNQNGESHAHEQNGNSVKAAAVVVPSEFLSPRYSCFGEAQLRNRIVSHPDVGKKWYPDLYARYSQQKVV